VNAGLPPVYAPRVPITIVGSDEPDGSRVLLQLTDEQYAATMGIALLQGRLLSTHEVNTRTHSAVVNQAFVRHYFSSAPALGRLVRIPVLRERPLNLTDDSFVIVGVVRDTVNQVSSREILPELVIPFTIVNRSDRLFVLSTGPAESVDNAVKAQIYAADPGQPVTEDQSMATVLRENAYATPRFNLLLFGIFATLGLVLALFGIYGVISHTVAQQTREIGIRIALGADFSQVIGMVLGLGAKLVGIGIAVGLAASLASVKLLSGLVRNVSSFDPYSFAAVTVLLVLTGLLAVFWPARRAARVDPLIALRDE
jgi:putative ABC transport system permease protein